MQLALPGAIRLLLTYPQLQTSSYPELKQEVQMFIRSELQQVRHLKLLRRALIVGVYGCVFFIGPGKIGVLSTWLPLKFNQKKIPQTDSYHILLKIRWLQLACP